MNTADNHSERRNWRYLPEIARSLLNSHKRCHLAVEDDVEQCGREQSAVLLKIFKSLDVVNCHLPSNSSANYSP